MLRDSGVPLHRACDAQFRRAQMVPDAVDTRNDNTYWGTQHAIHLDACRRDAIPGSTYRTEVLVELRGVLGDTVQQWESSQWFNNARHGIMTTNISEALNSVLKKAKVPPLKTLVELIFNKLVKYFHQHREEAENCVHPFPTRIFDKFLRIKMKSREHKVTTYNPREGIYMVRSPIRVSEQILMCRRYICDKRTEELTKRIFIRS
ncbi:hypothetical protein M9H77_18826 [Catharanthus roseus]|uniref:Uncharacterized protein n=1 Tax=Catharanthus roseus TaxID=4058 RepID=A0ACC0B8N2_CATRO|nr:hypothetical protein M9H77_18826 [Catharanthus roseus]